jgi:agmatinase
LEIDPVGILWIDAHADLRDRYRGREDNHACAARRSSPFGPILQVGVRSYSEGEYRWMESHRERVRWFRRWGPEAREALRALPDRVYLSVDVDGFDPSVVRSVGTPEPGGLGWEEGLAVLEALFEEKEVVAFDVVELCPSPEDAASDFTVARLIYKILTLHFLHRPEV